MGKYFKHTTRNDPIYKIWLGIKTRCYNKNRKDYKYYGGRGIILSEEFKNDFYCFYKYLISLTDFENKEKNKLTLDRINNNGNYERGNLQWISRAQQGRNQRSNRNITYNNITKCLSDWSIDYNINIETLSHRLDDLNWCLSCSLTIRPSYSNNKECKHK